jgi:hypothetical protein
MKNPLRTARTSLLLAAALLCATRIAVQSATLEDLLVPGATIVSGDKVFSGFHNPTQVGDLSVPLNEIFVDPIVGGPGTPETEPGIRFSSALWTLTGPNLHYDLGIDFHVRTLSGAASISDNTLEFTGNWVGDGRAQVAEGVLDHLTGATVANKLVFFDKFGERLQDHEVYPGGPYVELEISKDFQMSTGVDPASRVFVSHFDQTFSQVPEGAPGFAAAFTVFGMLAWAGRARRQVKR